MLVTTAEIDEIRKAPGEREIYLYIDVERGEWLLPRASFLLQEKLNAYASFVLDGKIRELYPYALPANIRIVIRSRGQAPGPALALVSHVAALLLTEGPVLTLEHARGPRCSSSPSRPLPTCTARPSCANCAGRECTALAPPGPSCAPKAARRWSGPRTCP